MGVQGKKVTCSGIISGTRIACSARHIHNVTFQHLARYVKPVIITADPEANILGLSQSNIIEKGPGLRFTGSESRYSSLPFEMFCFLTRRTQGYVFGAGNNYYRIMQPVSPYFRTFKCPCENDFEPSHFL
jgi:hypothetical protein